ncbi:MAG: hypothetical protein REI78_16250 [Pedobacter sp.]|nr:hypothetical protein [Pedobacter sp.]MDQ8054583.1 hypothetical protein [Pedobacter sp.]
MVKRLIFALILLFPISLWAQNNILTGNVYDFNNRTIILEGSTIKNLNSKSVAIADKDGHFAINAKIGDLVSFGMVGYHTDTLYLTSLFPKNIYLRAQTTELKAVDIAAVKVSPYLNAKDPNAMPARRVDYSKERGGLRLSLGYGKYRREQAKIQELEERDQYLEEINKNFNEETIRSLVKFEGPGIRDFILLYRPSVEMVKAERPFNYTMHIAKSYRSWMLLPEDQRKLPPLPKLKSGQ